MKTINRKTLFLPVLAFCSFLVGFDLIVTIPLIPTMAKETNMPIELGGLLVAVYAVFYALSAPVFGALSDRLGRKKMLLFGSVVFALATALTGTASSFVMLLTFRALSGIGAGMVGPVVFALVGDRYAYKERGRAIGIVTGALISASIVGVPLGGYVAQLFSWRLAFWLIGFLSIASSIAVWKFIPNIAQDIQKTDHSLLVVVKQFRTALSNRSVFLALLVTLLYYGGLQGMFVNIGTFYSIKFDLTSGDIGLVLMTAGFGSVIGSVVGGRLADKYGKKVMILGSSLVVAASVMVISMTNSLVPAILINVLWATVYGFGQSALTALISELSPSIRGTVMSLNSSAMHMGSALFAAIAASLLHGGSFIWIGIFCAAANVIVFLVTMIIRERQPKEVRRARTAKDISMERA
ncbi:MFS transporter [Pseudalkalibacillus caeni]|uniref:MFS transporter n=1 Tax=Exobacillus caeni TaxID=2574798 RepID=A0A5R9FBR1_9BACL|nr:MFS transporter [Pseudalkalibacillus caeni]TLS37065.1 MFS transporter [Pseudalkalibacillus caeni]